MRKPLAYVVLSLTTALASALHAASGTEGGSFLDIPVGARPAALGSAYSALASDAYAPVWNPAGLGFTPSTEIAGQHLSYLESVHYEYLGLAQPLGSRGSFGAAIQYLGSGQIAGTDNSGSSLGDYSSYFAAYNLAYAHRLGEFAALGLTGKWINARISDFSANAYSVDLGAMVRPAEAWSFAATVTNLGSKLTFLNSGDSLPLAGHLAGAFRPDLHWTVTAEAVQAAAGLTSGRGGVEWRPIAMLALRAGYKSDTVKEQSAMAGMTAGLGLMVWGQELSYAWLPLGDLGTGHYFSLVVRLGAESEKRRNLIYYRPSPHRARRAHEAPGETDPDLEEIIQLIKGPERQALAAAWPAGQVSR